MQLKLLFDGRYQILGVVHKGSCEADDFINTGEASTKASRAGLHMMLEHIAANGLQNLSPSWSHEVDKKNKIYEFIKGDLRLFYFSGDGRHIAICTGGVLKKGQKADKPSVARAAEIRKQYEAAVANQTIEVIHDENE